MAYVLALLFSGRRRGYTSSLLKEAAEGAGESGAEVELVPVQRYRFGPCTSCFECIRREEHRCVLSDDMGRDGELFDKVLRANGIIFGDPVHNWGPSATCHLFVERLYPFLWSGELDGLPVASISCASNQGMHRLALEQICKWVFGFGMRWVGGIAVHTTDLERAKSDARALGRRLGEEAMKDSEGRRRFSSEQERYRAYLDAPWSPLAPYLGNLTDGTFSVEGSLILRAFKSFRDAEVRELLGRALEDLGKCLKFYEDGDREEASRYLVEAGALWTHATWKEFLEGDVIGTKIPEAYRPLDKAKADGQDPVEPH